MLEKMKLPEKLDCLVRAPHLTCWRIVPALAIAVAADTFQFLLGPFGWVFGDQLIDVLVMLLTSWLIGFHWLLLPTFVLELAPLTDELPTWVACVIAVVILRKRERRMPPPSPPEKPAIEI